MELLQSFHEGGWGAREEEEDSTDKGIKPKPKCKVVLHKKRASRRVKEYDDDGNTFIKPTRCIKLSLDEKSHESSISECLTLLEGFDDDSSTCVSHSRRCHQLSICDVYGGGAASGRHAYVSGWLECQLDAGIPWDAYEEVDIVASLYFIYSLVSYFHMHWIRLCIEIFTIIVH